jgi:hypothetical protein
VVNGVTMLTTAVVPVIADSIRGTMTMSPTPTPIPTPTLISNVEPIRSSSTVDSRDRSVQGQSIPEIAQGAGYGVLNQGSSVLSTDENGQVYTLVSSMGPVPTSYVFSPYTKIALQFTFSHSNSGDTKTEQNNAHLPRKAIGIIVGSLIIVTVLWLAILRWRKRRRVRVIVLKSSTALSEDDTKSDI